jgi:radical SAM superfamily enzyme YgiQ (UPF0313 family)
MKILFIYKYEYIEPIGIMYLSSFLKESGHECHFIDLEFAKDLDGEIRRISPAMISYSVTTGAHASYQKLNLELKQRHRFFSVFGGPHCTFFPEFIHEEGVDAICRGEGEHALSELAHNLEQGRDVAQIRNLWIKAGGKIHKNEVRPLIEDLDVLPFPDRDLVNKYNHYRKMHRRFILTGRGCPYNCSYCFNHAYNDLYEGKGRVIRKRSVGNVIEELQSVKDTCKPKRFSFVDDTFIIDKNWTLEFCRSYARDVGRPFVANIRPNLVSEDIVKALKDSGCAVVMYAIESGDDALRFGILDRNISREKIIDAGILLDEYEIKTVAQNIVGLPDETVEMAFETMKLNIQAKASYAWVSIFQPYPRTELGEYSKEKGYFDDRMDQFHTSFFNRSVMKMKDIEKLERLHHLFPFGVSFPFCIPLIRLLIRLPLKRLYLLLWNVHKAWNYTFKVRGIYLSELFIRE